jgi:N-acetylmuramoyl-L-alanine amidase
VAYSVKRHFLHKGTSRVDYVATIFDGGNFVTPPKVLVMHFTYGASGRSSANWFRDRTNPGSSAHVVIDRDGSVIQCADFQTVCWHAGRSRLRDIVGLNAHALSIEMANWGYLRQAGSGWKSHTGVAIANPVIATHKNGNPQGSPSPCGWEPYPEAQFLNAVAVAQALVSEYGLTEIVGHDDISRGRKWDPGPAFDMLRFRARVFGDRGENGDSRLRVTASEGLNLRAGPGTQYSALELLPVETILEVLARDGQWLSVSVIGPNDRPRATGWVHSQYVGDA